MIRSLAIAVLALCALTSGAMAVPTVRGATGLVFIPNASVSEGATIFTKEGKVSTGGDYVYSAFEGGLFTQDSRTFYDAKFQVLPDITSDDEWIPAVALGLRGVSTQNDHREYYFALQKKFSYPQCTAVWGMERAGKWSGNTTRGFYGLEWTLFKGFSILGDHENAGGTTNVGARYTVMKTVAVYYDVLDIKGRTALPKENIVGACYQKHF